MKQVSAAMVFRLKLAASLFMLGAILYAANWNEVWLSLAQVKLYQCLTVLGILLVIVFISAWKWQWLLRLHGAHFVFANLSRWYFIAAFFNNFLPTSIGGDGYRIYRTLDNERSRSTAIISVFVERLSGIVTLLGLGTLAIVASYLTTQNALSTLLLHSAIFGVCVLSAVFILLWLIHSFTGFTCRGWLQKKYPFIAEHLKDYTHNLTGSLVVLGVSVLFHVLNIFALWLLIRWLGAGISMIEMTIVIASVNIVSLLPLSINGFGLVDGAFIYLLGLFGVDYAQGLSFSILLRFLVIPVSAVGMILYLADKRKATPDSTASFSLKT